MGSLVVTLLAMTLAISQAAIDPQDDSTENLLPVVPCVKQLSDKYVKSARASQGSLVFFNIQPDISVFQLNILKAFNNDPLHKTGLMVKDLRKRHPFYTHVVEKAKNYMLMIAKSTDLDAPVSKLQRLPTWNPLAQVVVLFTEEITPPAFQIEVRNVLEKLFKLAMLNVNVMVQRYNTSVLEVWTWFPYENGGCADKIVKIRLMDECEFMEASPESIADSSTIVEPAPEYFRATSKSEAKLWTFREKRYDEYGPKMPKVHNSCPLKISTPIWEPFVVGNGTYVEKGLEVLMIDAITTRLQLTPVYKVIDPHRAAAKITDNSSTSLYAELMKREMDLMIGGLYENPISRKLLSSSIPYYQDDLTWCVPTARPAPKWLNVFIIFNIWTWMLAILIVFIAAIIIYGFVHVEETNPENYTWSVLQSVAISFSAYAHYWPLRFSVRMFLFIYMVYGLHFNAAYHSFLISVLTQPRFETQIGTAADAMANDFQFAGPENTLVHFDKPDAVSKYIGSVYQVCQTRDDCLARLHSERKLAVAVSRAHFASIGEDEIFCFERKDNIQTYSVGMMAKKHFHLLAKINDLIRRISESGLLGKWQVESDKVRVDDDLDGGGGAGEEVQIVFTVEHILGAFVLVVIGLGLGLIAFIWEIIYFKLQVRFKWNDSLFSKLFC